MLSKIPDQVQAERQIRDHQRHRLVPDSGRLDRRLHRLPAQGQSRGQEASLQTTH